MSYSFRSINKRPKRDAFGQNRQSRPTQNRKGPKKQFIHPSRFVKAARVVEAREEYVPKHAFRDFDVHELIHKNLETKGYTDPSPIQDQTIPHGLNSVDIIGVANTGTGKTVAFALPMLHRLISDPKSKALIMAPTRELAQQIEAECKWIARGSGLFGTLLIGGANINPQLRDLKQNPRIVIGTPGRIKDHLERRTLDLSEFNIVVLDEVDRMLDMGFVHDMREILSQIQKDRQSFFFSATMDRNVSDLIQTFSKDPITVSVVTGETGENIEQDIVPYEHMSEKIEQLHNLLLKEEVKKTIVFDDTQRSVERLANELKGRGFSVDAIHGGKSQGQRQRALKAFKDDRIKILVATDVAARGIDVPDVTHVINYETPATYDDYVHRIGRAGRAGKKGMALTFVAAR